MEVIEKQWLDLVKIKPYAFGVESGFTDLENIHNEWIKTFLFSKEDVTLQAHRRQLQDDLLIHCNGIDDNYLPEGKHYILA